MEYHFKDDSNHLYAHFAMPYPKKGGMRLAAMQDLGKDFAEIYRSFEEAIESFSIHRTHSEVILWNILWKLGLKNHSRNTTPESLHPALEKAIKLIELRLGEPLLVSQIAHESEISHNHLTRLIQQHFGTTVVALIRNARVQRAKHLLLYSTLSIKAIAVEVGIPDLHLFNKTIRQSLGASPRKYRAMH